MSDDRSIGYGRQSIDESDIEAVVKVLRGEWLTQGPKVVAFENALADYCGAKHAVAVSSGTVALHLACLVAGIGPGDEGVTSPISFLASANCLVYANATPRFADIDAETLNVDPVAMEKQITPQTKVLIPVHFAGLPCDMEAIQDLATPRGLVVIEDACHALGATIRGKRVGGSGFSDMACFSFHPVKHITTGEGGAVVTDNDEFASRLRSLRHHGMTKDPAILTRDDGPWYYEAHFTGYNGRISDLSCALGLSQLSKLNGFLSRRRKIAFRYRDAFEEIEGLRCQSTTSDTEHAYHLFVIHLDPKRYRRAEAFAYLFDKGINAQVHYVPLHRQPVFGTRSESLENAEYYYEGCLSLPMFPSLTDDQQTRVIDAVQSFCTKNRAG